VAVTWVDSFTGRALDLAALKAACVAAGALLVVNGSQAVGARPVDLSTVDVLVSCGYKWLCGPYGTGFAWVRPEVLSELEPRQAYWLAMHAGRGLDEMRSTTLRTDLGVRAFDVFCPASFGNTLPWLAALDLLLDIGIDAIADHDQRLVERFVSGLDLDRYALVSPAEGPARSTLVVLSAVDGETAALHRRLTGVGVDTAFREGNLRLSMHLFNTGEQVDRVLELLHDS
jgi:selenocysteine lyase/cysteine desulfurase